MSNISASLTKWFAERPQWLQIKDLAKLKDADCNLLDSLMAKYSGFEHSQPAESPVELPKLDDLLADVTSLKNWREEYAKRSASSVAG